MRAIAVLVFLLCATQSDAEQISVCNGRTYKTNGFLVPCSHTWALHATCTSRELVHEWNIPGNKPDDHYIRPFADFPITVIGYEMVKVVGGPTIFFMIGSGHQPDAFLWMGPGENRARWMMGPGLGHPWPSKQEAAANWRPGHEEVIDVHGTCSVTPSISKEWYRRLWERLRGTPPTPSIAEPVTLLVTVYYVSNFIATPPSK